MHTAFPDFQDALLSVIDAAVTDCPVTLGWPAGGLESDHVWIAGAGTVTPHDPLSTLTQRDETLTCEVRIITDYTASDYTTSRDRAFEIAEDVEDAIAAAPTLGDVVTYCVVSGIRVGEAIPDERTRQVGITLTVTAEATVS